MKLQYHETLSNFAFNFDLRHYSKASAAGGVTEGNVGGFMLAANDIVAKLDKSRRDAAEAKSVEAAGPGRYCPPLHPTHFEPSSREIDGIR